MNKVKQLLEIVTDFKADCPECPFYDGKACDNLYDEYGMYLCTLMLDATNEALKGSDE